jgi:hypothetical protein
MSPPDRLAELQRQRALVQQHLAWLDREIDAAGAHAAPSTPAPAAFATPKPFTAPAPFPAPALARPLRPVAIPDTDAEAIIRQYQSDPKSLTNDVRRGCLLYAAGAFALLTALVFGLYFLLRH